MVVDLLAEALEVAPGDHHHVLEVEAVGHLLEEGLLQGEAVEDVHEALGGPRQDDLQEDRHQDGPGVLDVGLHLVVHHQDEHLQVEGGSILALLVHHHLRVNFYFIIFKKSKNSFLFKVGFGK